MVCRVRRLSSQELVIITFMNQASFDCRPIFKTSLVTLLALFDTFRLAFSSSAASEMGSLFCPTSALSLHHTLDVIQPCPDCTLLLVLTIKGSAYLIQIEGREWVGLIANRLAVLSNGDLYGSVCNE